MPRRALRCIVDLHLHALSAPGVWLPSKEDVYISISLFSQYRNTRLLTSVFPLLIDEKFRFEKTYYTAVDPSQVAEMLDDELIIFELVQLSEYTDGAVRLASYSTRVRDFLYPYPHLYPSYRQSEREREVLMSRTIAFPGISPKIEFSTQTSIKESVSPELDALDDALDMEKEYRASRRARTRSPSPTLRRRLADVNLNSTIDPRPPFVVRKLESDLIGRKPGSANIVAKSKKKRSSSPYRPISVDDFNVSYNATPRYRSASPYRGTRFSTVDNDIDREVEALTSIKTTPIITPRPRSISPLLYRTSFRSRYGDTLLRRPYSPTYYERLIAREEELARIRRMNRLYGPYYPSMDDLELDLRLSRIRAGIY